MAKKKNLDASDQIIKAIADLQEAAGGRFEKLDSKLSEHTSRFDDMDKNFREVRGDITYLRQRFERMEAVILRDLLSRIERLEHKVGSAK